MTRPDNKKLRNFGITLGVAGGIVLGVILPFVWGIRTGALPWVIGGVILGIAVLLPSCLRFVYEPWMKFAHYLGIINTSILLFIIFVLFVIPVAIVFKLRSSDPMNRKFDPEAASYRVASEQPDLDNLDRPF